MAFVEVSSGGGSVLPVLGQTPDKYIVFDTAGTSGTSQINVTQKPRFLLYSMWSRTSNYYGFLGVVDVENNRAYRSGYMASGITNAAWTNWQNFFTTVSDTKVVYSFGALSYNSRVAIHVYY